MSPLSLTLSREENQNTVTINKMAKTCEELRALIESLNSLYQDRKEEHSKSLCELNFESDRRKWQMHREFLERHTRTQQGNVCIHFILVCFALCVFC